MQEGSVVANKLVSFKFLKKFITLTKNSDPLPRNREERLIPTFYFSLCSGFQILLKVTFSGFRAAVGSARFAHTAQPGSSTLRGTSNRCTFRSVIFRAPFATKCSAHRPHGSSITKMHTN